jgi:hypothetical protein
MRTNISLSWAGKTDAEDGIATFTVGTYKTSIPLPSFKIAYDLNDLLLKAYRGGEGRWRLGDLVLC